MVWRVPDKVRVQPFLYFQNTKTNNKIVIFRTRRTKSDTFGSILRIGKVFDRRTGSVT
jgi:hypothetical protein